MVSIWLSEPRVFWSNMYLHHTTCWGRTGRYIDGDVYYHGLRCWMTWRITVFQRVYDPSLGTWVSKRDSFKYTDQFDVTPKSRVTYKPHSFKTIGALSYP